MTNLLEKLTVLAPAIGQTPLLKLDVEEIELYVKLEYANLSGSIKARAAYNILYEAIKSGKVNADTTIIESSSGNFALALATLCKYLDLRFIPVIDPNINAANEEKIKQLTDGLVKVTERDETGGYLLSRIKYIKDYLQKNENTFWTNQYENPDNYRAYYNTLGTEIINSFDRLDYVFIAVSSGGTITGLSRKLKENFLQLKVVAVDVEGSMIFGNTPKRRNISGIGSSKVPEILKHARIDEIVIIPEPDIIKASKDLWKDQGVFGGASCGAAYQAVREYLSKLRQEENPIVLFICPDKGDTYTDTVYNDHWLLNNIPQSA